MFNFSRFSVKNFVISSMTALLFGTQTLHASTCPTGYHEQTNPFSRWSGCDIWLNGNGFTTSSSNGEWSAGFNFGDFITVKGKAYCLQEQYSMPSQKVCVERTFPVVENVDITKTGSTCWCKVTAWQPFTTSRDAPFQEIDASYIQIPVDNNEPCTLQDCGYICASIGNALATLVGGYYNNSGLRATIYKSVKQCLPDDQLTCDEIGYTLQDNECTPITYTITYKDKDNNLITEFVETSVATTYTIESETITLPTPSAPEGMEFAGWYNNNEFSGNVIEQIEKGSTENRVLYAKFVEVEYTLTFNVGDGNTVNAITYTYGILPFDLPVPTNNNDKTFVGWYENAGFSGDAVTQITKDSYGTKTLYAKWGETETPIVTPESECEPGYYLPQDSDTCAICEENNYCTGGTNPIMQPCPTGLVSPTGTVSADNCGKIMLVGEDVLYLTQKQQTTPALAVKLDNKTYYAKTTPLSQIEQQTDINTKYFLRTKIDNVEYAIHDNTVQRRN